MAATWPALTAEHPLAKLHARLPEILTATSGYASIWGITLVVPEGEGDDVARDFHTMLVLQKFLRANSNNIDAAFDQLKETLVWRQGFFGPDGDAAKGWDDTKFAGLGYVSEIPSTEEGKPPKVICWNVYGATKDLKSTFGDLDEFVRWRVALMEASLARLALPAAAEPIPDYDAATPTVDPYLTIQVHDYKNVSFLRLPSEVRAASKKVVEMFGRYYPETLEHKYFVNVPGIMGWVYTLMKKFVARATMQKLEMLGSGKELAKHIGSGVPEAYGGSGEALATVGETVTSPVKVGGALEPEKKEEEAEEKTAEEAEAGHDAAAEKKDEAAAAATLTTGEPIASETKAEEAADSTLTAAAPNPEAESLRPAETAAAEEALKPAPAPLEEHQPQGLTTVAEEEGKGKESFSI